MSIYPSDSWRVGASGRRLRRERMPRLKGGCVPENKMKTIVLFLMVLVGASFLQSVETVDAVLERKSLVVLRSCSSIPSDVFASFAKLTDPTMAEPADTFDATNGVSELPKKRLISVAVDHQYCVLIYEQGGRAYNKRVLVFLRSKRNADPIWGGKFLDNATTPSQILALKKKGKVDTTPLDKTHW